MHTATTFQSCAADSLALCSIQNSPLLSLNITEDMSVDDMLSST